ncbi:SDR family oxidoreductase [Chryseobacterium populi]|uniref:Short-chain dehydrogenase, teichoic and lipoteichoic acid D-alanine esterification n=1 Tax=Chryseobacterium populi TaxID=1144316 RepID=J2SVH2_9FLAO|nr:SDR family NAD(P)-dependent oxidoreductase [Chryseobacterium populi]EJL69572.1 short-chain dehydrogenase, teichoic and lipoteichoic acid D-alanine esterification [Chryseobacterium populi]
MNTKHNTVLISGGTAGIGLEIAKLFSANGNKVIITGRTKERLEKALQLLPNATGIQCDITNEEETNALVEKVKSEHKELNVLINNAGAAHVYNLAAENVNAVEKAQEEMLTNYFSIIRLNEKLLPLLKQQKEAAIVNVSSVVAFVPGSLATYSASKAALHSYTQSLRIALNKEVSSSVKVFELMPPLVDTEFSAPIGGHNGIPASEVATQFINGFENDDLEIRVGQTEDIYRLHLANPSEALKVMNGLREQLK